jgi:hypothetical protein
VLCSPRSLRARISRRASGLNFNFLPNLTPRFMARSLPSLVRARMRWVSKSASPPKIVIIKRPCAVVVSAHGSPSERKGHACTIESVQHIKQVAGRPG